MTRSIGDGRFLGAVLALGILALAGCSPRYTPNDPGIPEARAAATAELDAAIERVVFSDDAVVLGEGRGDSCQFADGGTFNTGPSNYRCGMHWKALIVIPEATTREEMAVALDREIVAMGLPVADSVVRSLVTMHPNSAGSLPIGTGASLGDVIVSIESEPFRPQFWPAPAVLVSGNVSKESTLDDVTASQVQATGATQIVIASARLEYWAEEEGSLPGAGEAPPDLVVEHSAHGANYYFDLAQAQPESAVDPCLADPLVAPGSITRTDEPFWRLTFKLYGAATSTDAARVRDCLTSGLESGTLAWYDPYYRETPAPVPTPGPGVDPPS